MRTVAIGTLAIIILTALMAVSPVRAENPTWSTDVRIDGIFGGDSNGRIQEITEMLKAADQKILDLKILARNGYGKILHAQILHTSILPLNDAVLAEAKALRVTIDGIWGGNSARAIASQVATLKSAEQVIIRVEATSYNGYGKILAANVYYLSKFKYDALIAINH